MKARDLLSLGASLLPKRPGIPDPRREATWLLAHAWGISETRVRLEPDSEVPEGVAARFSEWLHRRAAGEPAHHLSGLCPFFGRDFVVSPAVLIPRPETEMLVELALNTSLPAESRVLDVGTGSGCIAVCIAAERPSWQVTASDTSLAALAVAQANNNRHRVTVQMVCSDLTSALGGLFDLVTANLPYIPSANLDSLPMEVGHDPELALDGGADGLDLVRVLLATLPGLLKPDGSALLELGEDQADAVATIATSSGLCVCQRIEDLGGFERIVMVQRA